MKLKKNAYNQYPEFDIDDPIPILKKYKQSSYFLQVEEKKWMVLSTFYIQWKDFCSNNPWNSSILGETY